MPIKNKNHTLHSLLMMIQSFLKMFKNNVVNKKIVIAIFFLSIIFVLLFFIVLYIDFSVSQSKNPNENTVSSEFKKNLNNFSNENQSQFVIVCELPNFEKSKGYDLSIVSLNSEARFILPTIRQSISKFFSIFSAEAVNLQSGFFINA